MIEIRYATVEDADALGDIHARSWKAAYRGIVPDEVLDRISPEKSQARLKKAIAEGKEKYGIILVDQIPAGLICYGKCRDEDKDSSYGEIWGIYLAPEFYGKGIGIPLMNWGIQELQKNDYQKATLWVLEDNVRARRFYEKVGFTFEGTVKQLTIGKPLNECRYIKDIKI